MNSDNKDLELSEVAKNRVNGSALNRIALPNTIAKEFTEFNTEAEFNLAMVQLGVNGINTSKEIPALKRIIESTLNAPNNNSNKVIAKETSLEDEQV